MSTTEVAPTDTDAQKKNHKPKPTQLGSLLPLCYPHFVPEDESAFDMFGWERRDAQIVQSGETAFEQKDMEFPSTWSDTAVAIVAQKYARGGLGTPERETSLKQIIGRVANTITEWGISDGYFDTAEARIFQEELTWLLTAQRASFNSPVWFNIGVPNTPQQASACFILAIDDNMEAILNWYVEEGLIFRNGSGAGINLSPLRGSMENLSSGGIASGPVSFMRGADASAGAIKSGGRTRRSAKMVLIDDEHPDVMDFVNCKVVEEAKARALAAAGFDMSLHSDDAASIGFRNANHSVRLSDAFMKAVEKGETWRLRGRNEGGVTDTVEAKDLIRSIAEAAHACGDPGVQFTDTINRWHTAPNAGPINASNPCSEYMHIDNSACNLASINLLSFLSFSEDGTTPVFDAEGFVHACQVLFIAQDILVTHADYPTEQIGINARNYRQLGLGFANLGAMLMSMGLAYDSSESRLMASGITALMGGAAYATSARMAEKLGPFAGYAADQEACANVMQMHRAEMDKVNENYTACVEDQRLSPLAVILPAATAYWDAAVRATASDAAGLRNAQATLLAPTGTISFMMDCDTTGIEPDFALKKSKQLVGGGFLNTVNQSVTRALTTLGYDEHQIAQATDWLTNHGDFGPVDGQDSPVKEEHLDVFACAVGHRAISPLGHMKMMSACQPFLSGAISKTVNVPADVTISELEELIHKAHVYGIKALAIYRDGSKATQPLVAASSETDEVIADTAVYTQRRRLPRKRKSETTKFTINGCEGYLTAGLYDDGQPGEVFINVAKEGTPLSGMIDAFGIGLSFALQHGASLESLTAAYQGMQFEPRGFTDDPDIRIAQSLPDYIMKRLALDYLPVDALERLGVQSVQDNIPSDVSIEEGPKEVSVTTQAPAALPALSSSAPLCSCGSMTIRSGTCWACPNCGNTTGCS